jgi:two-component system, OmpR family, response regulator ChvI
LIEREEQQELSFSGRSQNYCVCFVSMVDSADITFEVNNAEKIRMYYSIFVNTMAAIARSFDAKIIKNTNTSLLFYFPKTSDSTNKSAFRGVIECGITMIAANDVINAKLRQQGGATRLPPLYYRISADYGRLEMAKSITSPDADDLFGSTMNICAKINSMSPPNGMVIGGDLYHIIKKSSSSLFDDHRIDFKGGGQYSITGFKHQYPVYSVLIRNKDNKYDINILNIDKQIPQIMEIHQDSVTAPTNDALKTKTQYYNIHNQYYQQHNEKEEEPQEQKHPPNIMLVDDEPDMLLTYKTFLSSENYNIDAFTDAQESLQQFAQVNPSYYDLVVMDIRMPGLNGLQLYHRLKAMNPNVKILFLSALDAAEEMISVLPGMKLDDVIRKPVEQEHFLKKLKSALQ